LSLQPLIIIYSSIILFLFYLKIYWSSILYWGISSIIYFSCWCWHRLQFKINFFLFFRI